MQTLRIRRPAGMLARACAAALALVGAEPLAQAGTWDLNLARLCQLRVANQPGLLDCGGGYDRAIHGEVLERYPDNAAFRSLMSELGALFAPNVLARPRPTATTASPSPPSSASRRSTRRRTPATRSPTAPGGKSITCTATGAPRVGERHGLRAGGIRSQQIIERIERELPPSIAPTISVMARKGLWLPVPSFELGVGVRHLIGSHMFAGIAQAKVALHEGFQGWPPALAIGARHGQPGVQHAGFSLTVAGLDFSISKHFGVASTFNLMPYLGYQLLWMFADSEVIDATPGIDGIQESARSDPDKLHQCMAKDCNAYFTFDHQDDITRHRFFIGLRTNFYLFSFLLEYSYFAAGRTGDAIFGQPETPDESGAQHSINFALALDY